MKNLNTQDKNALLAMVYRESGGEPLEGMKGVAAVIMNRTVLRPTGPKDTWLVDGREIPDVFGDPMWGSTVYDTVTAPIGNSGLYQFEPIYRYKKAVGADKFSLKKWLKSVLDDSGFKQWKEDHGEQILNFVNDEKYLTEDKFKRLIAFKTKSANQQNWGKVTRDIGNHNFYNALAEHRNRLKQIVYNEYATANNLPLLKVDGILGPQSQGAFKNPEFINWTHRSGNSDLYTTEIDAIQRSEQDKSIVSPEDMGLEPVEKPTPSKLPVYFPEDPIYETPAQEFIDDSLLGETMEPLIAPDKAEMDRVMDEEYFSSEGFDDVTLEVPSIDDQADYHYKSEAIDNVLPTPSPERGFDEEAPSIPYVPPEIPMDFDEAMDKEIAPSLFEPEPAPEVPLTPEQMAWADQKKKLDRIERELAAPVAALPDSTESARTVKTGNIKYIHGQKFNIVNDPEYLKEHFGEIEFVHPEEPGNETGLPTIVTRNLEELGKQVGHTNVDKFYEGEALHYLPEVDSTFASMRREFAELQPPQQKAMDERVYKKLSTPSEGSSYVEKRPFEQWFERSRLDGYIRGYLHPDKNDEWRKQKVYSPEQIDLLEKMKSYLSTGEDKEAWEKGEETKFIPTKAASVDDDLKFPMPVYFPEDPIMTEEAEQPLSEWMKPEHAWMKTSSLGQMNLYNETESLLGNILKSAQLDNPIVQIGKSLSNYMQLQYDNNGKPEPGYNAVRDDPRILDKYGLYIGEFEDSPNPAHTQMIMDRIETNDRLRTELNLAGGTGTGARFLQEFANPFTYLPLTMYGRGLGLVKGAKRGAAIGAGETGVSEGLLYALDDTKPTEEVVLATAFGALLGGGVGGIAGSVNPNYFIRQAEKQIHHEKAVDAGAKLAESNPDVDVRSAVLPRFKQTGVKQPGKWNTDGIDPETIAEKIDFDKGDELPIEQWIVRAEGETAKAYKKRLNRIQNNPEELTMYREWANAFDERLIDTPFLLEKMRIKQHPYLFLKNNLFSGDLGNKIRRIADDLGGNIGLYSRASAKGRAMGQSVMADALQLNPTFQQVNEKMYNAFLRSMGFETKSIEAMQKSTSSRIVHSAKMALSRGKMKSFTEFNEDVSTYYATRKFDNIENKDKVYQRGVREAAEAARDYIITMGTHATQAKVFATGRLSRNIERYGPFITRLEEIRAKQQKQYIELKKLENDLQTGKAQKGTKGRIKSLRASLFPSRETYSDKRWFELEAEHLALPVDRRWLTEKARKSLNRYDNDRRALEHFEDLNAQGIGPQFAEEGGLGYLPHVYKAEEIAANPVEFGKILEKFIVKEHKGARIATAEIIGSITKRTLKDTRDIIEKNLKAAEFEGITITDLLNTFDEITAQKNIGTIRDQLTEMLNDLVYKHNVPISSNVKHVDTVTEMAENLASIKQMSNFQSADMFGMAPNMMRRKLRIPTAELLPYIETNMPILLRLYHRRMSPSIAMAKKYGDASMRTYIKTLHKEMQEQIAEAATDAERAQLTKEASDTLEVVKALRDKVLGVYGIPKDPGGLGNRSIATMKNMMVLALMGKAGQSALADLGKIVMTIGIKKAFQGGWQKFSTGVGDFKLAGKEVELAGEAAEMALHGRWDAMFEIGLYNPNVTKFEHIVGEGVQRMFILNMLAPWTDAVKRFSGSIIQSEMIRVSEKVYKGVELSRSEKLWLGRSGIGLDYAPSIYLQWRKAGRKKGNHLYLANTEKWKDKALAERFRRGLAEEVRNAVITPGPSDKLNFMSSPVGSLITQFKSFGLSSTYRTTLAGLQARDARAVQGITSMIALGYLIDMMRSPDYDSRDMFSFDRLSGAVDRSGVLGLLMDINNTLEVTSGNTIGARPIMGVKSLYGDPTLGQQFGAVFGPTASLTGDLVNTLLDPDSVGRDYARSVRRFLPFNNLIWINFLVNKIQQSTGEVLDDYVLEE